MSKKQKTIGVYFDEDMYWQIMRKKESEESLKDITEELLKKHYINKSNPEVKARVNNKNENKKIKKFTFNTSLEIFEDLEEKMALQKDKNKSKLIIEIFKKHYLKDMNYIQTITQDGLNLEIYYIDDLEIEKYSLDDYKIAKIIFSELDKIKKIIRFSSEEKFIIKFEELYYYFKIKNDYIILYRIENEILENRKNLIKFK